MTNRSRNSRGPGGGKPGGGKASGGRGAGGKAGGGKSGGSRSGGRSDERSSTKPGGKSPGAKSAGGGRSDRDGSAKTGLPRVRTGSGVRSLSSKGATAPTGGGKKKALGGDQIEGRQAVRELLLAGSRRAREVIFAADLDQAQILDEITQLANEDKVPIREISRSKFEAMARTDAPQGVMAFAPALVERDLDDLLTVRGGAVPFLLVVDGVTDPGNRAPAPSGRDRWCHWCHFAGAPQRPHLAVGDQGRGGSDRVFADGPRGGYPGGVAAAQGPQCLDGRPRHFV